VRDNVDRFVFFARNTVFVGGTALYTTPVDVRRYSSGVFVGWQGTGLGLTPASLEFTLEASHDLENWVDGSVLSPSADAEETASAEIEFPWIRWRAEVTGADPAVTGWLVGDLVRREPAGPGGGA